MNHTDKPIAIMAAHTVSALGEDPVLIWKACLDDRPYLNLVNFGKFSAYVGEIPTHLNTITTAIKNENKKYKSLDDSVLWAMYCARKTLDATDWVNGDFGINLGSSRGATTLFEKYHQSFLNHPSGKTATLSSPTTTLGNIATWTAQYLGSKGIAISHSITCSTALHALVNGVAWLKSGMATNFLVGASELSNTAFTISQMKALNVYTKNHQQHFPCKALDFDKKENKMCIGAGSGVFALTTTPSNKALGYIVGIGYATEPLTHASSISDDAICFQYSMTMALQQAGMRRENSNIDVVVMHATGTVKGDLAEKKALEKTFGSLPAITCNKWKIGHTLGASGAHSLFFALQMIKEQHFVSPPYLKQQAPKRIDYVMVNAVGFGGNAVSIIIGKDARRAPSDS